MGVQKRNMSEGYMLRMPDGMRAKIRQRADLNRRSMNAEIVHYLDRALAAENENGPAEAATSPDQEPTTTR